MSSLSYHKIIASAILTAVLCAATGARVTRTLDGQTAANTVITNRAEASYLDDTGASFGTVSQTITITVVAVATLSVSPKETAPSASVVSHESVTRLFKICNTGNTPDNYVITRAEVNTPANISALYFDNDASGTVTPGDAPVRIGETLSPRISAGSCLGVLATVDTGDAAPQSLLTIHLTARSSVANSSTGVVQDTGTIINAVGAGARLTSPDNPGLPPLKLAEGSKQAVVSFGNTFTYTVAFRNSGDVTALNVVVADDVAAGVDYVPGSLRLGSRSLSDADDGDEGVVRGRHIEVHLDKVDPNQLVTISFSARLTSGAAAGVGVVNTATISGRNVPLIGSSTAVVMTDPFGIVFSGRGGGSSPIGGARAEILPDANGSKLLPTPPDAGFVPNSHNDNPFTTDAQGHFNFALSQQQLGSEAAPGHYFMRVTAQGYVTRMLELVVRPTQAGLFALTERALDGQPIASAGGFQLVREPVQISDLGALAFNIPLFEQHGLAISKFADKPRAVIGDVITYRVEVNNPTSAPINNVTVSDLLPESFNYVRGTGRVISGSAIEQAVEPVIQNRTLLFHIQQINRGETARISYRVRIGVNARQGRQDNMAIASGTFPSGEQSQTAPAHASVMVGGGVFSTNQILIGRVFEDVNRNGKFDEGDKPLGGLRLYLSNGQSATTDSQGLYNFPSLGDGPVVISLDPITLPAGYELAFGKSVSDRSWTRLLRTPVGGGALLHQNFVLVRNGPKGKADDGRSLLWDEAARASTPSKSPSNTPSKEDLITENGKGEPNLARDTPPVKEIAPVTAGIYKTVATETLDPISPGGVLIVSPSANSVVMSAALQVEARVALKWLVQLEVNDERISDKNIGTTRADEKNKISTYTFVGMVLHPGSNKIHVTAISPEGKAGRSEELVVMGRGPARRLEMVSEKKEVQSGGRDSTTVHVRAFDQWNNPATDAQVAVDSSAGQLMRISDKPPVHNSKLLSSVIGLNSTGAGENTRPASPVNAEQVNQTRSQIIVQLEAGEGQFQFVGAGSPAEVSLHAQSGQLETTASIRITPEMRPTILVGLAEITVGQAVPEISLKDEEGHSRSRLSFFFSGRVWAQNMLTLAYDSQRPINRTAGRDRLFQLDPLDRVYPLFGDSSTRYEAAQSNSKLYARLDHNRSYAMFGDYDADMKDLALAGYARKLTGVKLHAENSRGDFITLTGARPDTSFARDVFPGGSLGLLQLSNGEILPGSETITLEVRDRRNPEIILSSEVLVRSVDYNLNAVNGELFFLRYISTFDFALNLTQIVVTYEHRATGLSSSVYTGRARKNFSSLGLRLGLSAVVQREKDLGTFLLGGFDGEKSLPGRGVLRFAYAYSGGVTTSSGNTFDSALGRRHGEAYRLELEEPLPFYQGVIRARYSSASPGFFNPFGVTVTAGTRREEVSFEFKPLPKSTLRFGFMDERNRTDLVDNTRITLSTVWDQALNDRIKLHFGYDHRSFNDEHGTQSTDSNLVTVGVDAQVTDKLKVSAKREQNLGEADPTYPTQTTLAATYQVTDLTKIFLTQRLASASITPISDLAQTGFAAVQARHETAFGVESRIGKYTSMSGRYQLENGINGTDSFAVIGLQNRVPLSKELSIELGFEHGFHLAGTNHSFDGATLGFGWQPNSDFRASGRYELRNRDGMGQLLALGAAGRVTDDITVMSRFQLSKARFGGHNSSSFDVTAAAAFRPLSSDRAGLLFSYTHRSLMQDGVGGSGLYDPGSLGNTIVTVLGPTRDRIDSLSTDGYFQATNDLELYGRFALQFNSNGQPDLPFVSTLTYLTQGRIQYRLNRRLDWAGETRLILQPSSGSRRAVYGTELGYWLLPDLRLGVGYNFTSRIEPGSLRFIPVKRGFYFTITSKISRIFDLVGTSKEGLPGSDPGGQSTTPSHE